MRETPETLLSGNTIKVDFEDPQRQIDEAMVDAISKHYAEEFTVTAAAAVSVLVGTRFIQFRIRIKDL